MIFTKTKQTIIIIHPTLHYLPLGHITLRYSPLRGPDKWFIFNRHCKQV